MRGLHRLPTPPVEFCLRRVLKLLCLQSFALTSMSFSDLPFLYDLIGGFLKMVLSNGDFELNSICASTYFWGVLTPG